MSVLNNIVKNNRGYEIGHISHRKDGDYKKVGKGEWEKVEEDDPSKSNNEEKSQTKEDESKPNERQSDNSEKKELTLEEKEDRINELTEIINNSEITEQTLYELGELNSLATKGYGAKDVFTQKVYDMKNRIIPKLAENLQKKGFSVKIGDDYVNYDNKKNNVIYFEKDGVQVSFHGSFDVLANRYPKAKEGEWNGLYNSWKYKTKEEQKKAKEKQDLLEGENKKIMQKYSEKARNELRKMLKRKGIAVNEKELERVHIVYRSLQDIWNPYEQRKYIEKKGNGLQVSIPWSIEKALGNDNYTRNVAKTKLNERTYV